jgi:hypothetical protein
MLVQTLISRWLIHKEKVEEEEERKHVLKFLQYKFSYISLTSL